MAAIELLSRYESGKDKLSLCLWLVKSQSDGSRNIGDAAKNGVYFLLSNRWDKTKRTPDNTHRIDKLFSMPCYCGHDCARYINIFRRRETTISCGDSPRVFIRWDSVLIFLLRNSTVKAADPRTCLSYVECPFVKRCKKRSVDSCSECPEYPCKEIINYQAKCVNKCNFMGLIA